MHRAGHGKGTFYNQLRHYPAHYGVARSTRAGLTPAHEAKKVDDFQVAQDHYNPRFKREMSLVHTYQHMMNSRLSRPKNQDGGVEVEVNTKDHRTRVFRNSSPDLQLKHQSVFYNTHTNPFNTP